MIVIKRRSSSSSADGAGGIVVLQQKQQQRFVRCVLFLFLMMLMMPRQVRAETEQWRGHMITSMGDADQEEARLAWIVDKLQQGGRRAKEKKEEQLLQGRDKLRDLRDAVFESDHVSNRRPKLPNQKLGSRYNKAREEGVPIMPQPTIKDELRLVKNNQFKTGPMEQLGLKKDSHDPRIKKLDLIKAKDEEHIQKRNLQESLAKEHEAKKNPIMMHLQLDLHRRGKQEEVPTFKWKVVSATDHTSTAISSSDEDVLHRHRDSANVFVSKFMVTADEEYLLIIDDDVEQNASIDQLDDFNVTFSLRRGSLVIAKEHHFSSSPRVLTETTRHVVSFTPTKSNQNQRRKLQVKDDIVKPDVGNSPVARPTPAPIQIVKPPVVDDGGGGIPDNNGGGNGGGGGGGGGDGGGGGNNGDGGSNQGDATPAPTEFVGTRPPVFSGVTSQPSRSNMPSSQPTIEPPCTSITGSPIQFSDYLSARFRLTDAGVVPTFNHLQRLVSDMEVAYNNVATCSQKGAFRSVNTGKFIKLYEGGGTRREIEVIALLFGSCEGCSPRLDLFFRAQETGSSNSTNRQLAAAPCFCPAPTRQAFLEEFNRLQAAAVLVERQASSIGNMLDVMELKKVDSCSVATSNTSQGEEKIQPEVHTALVSIVLRRDPDEMSNAELDEVLMGFRDVFHSNQGFTSGTCDLSRKEILTVEVDPEDRTIGRRLRGTPGEQVQGDTVGTSSRRHLQQTSADFEFMLVVTFQCFGCEGRLLGVTNFTTPTLDCLCPINPTRKGVEPPALISPWNEALAASTIIDQSVSDVIEVQALECSATFDIFSAVVVIEYILPSNLTEPTDADIQALEEEFAAGYNGLARRYCDPHHRRLSSAETILYKISEDGLTASFEMSVIGTCRNCDDAIKVYDPESFFRNANITYERNIVNADDSGRRRLSPPERRNLQLDTTCYCNVAASRELGPSEPEVVQNFGALVDELSLKSIRNVSECKFLTFFQTAIFLNFQGDVASATQDELDLIGQTFVTSYNQANQQEGVCDSLFRELTDFRIDRDVAVSDGGFSEGAALSDPGGRSRRILTKTSYRSISRRAQQEGGVTEATSSPTFDPSAGASLLNNITSDDPTLLPTTLVPAPDVVASSNTLILLQVSGTCRGCSSEFGLFNQFSSRRRLEDNGDEDNNPAAEDDTTTFTDAVKQRIDSCFCPPQSTRFEPSKEQLQLALSSLPFVDGSVELQEVALVECSVEIVDFETTIVVDFSADGEIGDEDEASVGAGFIEIYTRLSEDYCDDLFRRPEMVVSVRSEPISSPDENGVYRARFWIQLKGSCRGCQDDEDLFDRQSRRRRMQETEFCFCEPGAEDRAPTAAEFQKEYVSYFEGRRRSLSNRELVYTGRANLRPLVIWQLGNEMSAKIFEIDLLLWNPNGIQNWPNCINLPDEDSSSFIGDGYCDRATDQNGEYIYNIEECGYDGGDCCASTCKSFTGTCGEFGYACEDPNERDDPVNDVQAASLATDVPGQILPAIVIDIAECTSQLDAENNARLGDGVCDVEFNLPFCGFDGGDCCPSTCTLGDSGVPCNNPGGESFCIDPNAQENFTPKQTCLLSPECNAFDSSFCGDGWCDYDLNNAECGYDGGDCCEASCVFDEPSDFPCGANNAPPYDCVDPDFAPKLSETCMQKNATLDPRKIGDGFCDKGDYNTLECGYDGGDCCPSTCVGECPFFSCRDEGILPPGCGSTSDDLKVQFLGDGFCDAYSPYNTAECGWDFGDCCPDTCESTIFLCGYWASYACVDPSSPFQTISVECAQAIDKTQDSHRWLGDGYCDDYRLIVEASGLEEFGLESFDDIPQYNTDVCGYDYGDCCPGTCQDAAFYDCGIAGYACRDTTTQGTILAECAALLGGDVDYISKLGNGVCEQDSVYNVEACNFDYGDCCRQTCSPSYICEEYGGDYNCIDTSWVPDECWDENEGFVDPNLWGNGSCDEDYNTPACNFDGGDCCEQYGGDTELIGNGICDAFGEPGNSENIPQCLYDGGDCCEESCTGDLCGFFGYDCRDPEYNPPVPPPTECLLANPNAELDGLWGNGYCDDEYNTPACNFDNGDCCEGLRGYIGDEVCDDFNNNPECLYDGGDCCEVFWIGDGYCDDVNNNPACWYDGGDCLYDGGDCWNDGGDCCEEFWIGDGYCDDVNNNPECLYDGGDCCEESCTGDLCGAFGYDCGDPQYRAQAPVECLDLNPDSNPDSWGNGVCDEEFNTQECNFDNGDCCEGFRSSIGDGYCDDDYNNNPECLYDGGDCCEESCTSFSCYGATIYTCLDPQYRVPVPVPEECSVDSPNSYGNGVCDEVFNTPECNFDNGDCCKGFRGDIGDGFCDDNYNNNPECLYDGGDCCEESCTSSSCYGATINTCLDPQYRVPVPVPDECLVVNPNLYGNGVCDEEFNTQECNFDNGDCCEGIRSSIGDGYCDDDYNNSPECLYDGGDCCAESCTSFSCYGATIYTCLDPQYRAQAPVECLDLNPDSNPDSWGNGVCDDEFNNQECNFDNGDCCEGDRIYIGDGYCDDDYNNNPECLYDGGDCCEESCTSSSCYGATINTCLDPVYLDNPLLGPDALSAFASSFGAFAESSSTGPPSFSSAPSQSTPPAIPLSSSPSEPSSEPSPISSEPTPLESSAPSKDPSSKNPSSLPSTSGPPSPLSSDLQSSNPSTSEEPQGTSTLPPSGLPASSPGILSEPGTLPPSESPSSTPSTSKPSSQPSPMPTKTAGRY